MSQHLVLLTNTWIGSGCLSNQEAVGATPDRFEPFNKISDSEVWNQTSFDHNACPLSYAWQHLS